MREKIKKETRGRKPGLYYVSNEDLVAEVKKYYDIGVFSHQLGVYIKTIVEGVAHMPNFINYFKEENPWGVEMKSDAIWRITKSIYDENCKVIDEDQIGDVDMDDAGNIVYVVDEFGEFELDEDGEKVEKLVKQNNIHSYFTRTARNAFIGRIKKEKKNDQDLSDYRDKVFADYEQEYGIAHQEEGEYKDENSW